MLYLLALVGESGSGKDTFCQYLVKVAKPVFCFRFSDPLAQALKIFQSEVRKEDQQWLAIVLRERFGNNILGQALARKIKTIKKGLVILNGMRDPSEERMVRSLGGKIVYLTASPKVRWQRVKVRGEKADDNVSFEKFLKREKAQTENSIGAIGRRADFKIENNGTRQKLGEKAEKILRQIRKAYRK